jgi:hypothetical protein
MISIRAARFTLAGLAGLILVGPSAALGAELWHSSTPTRSAFPKVPACIVWQSDGAATPFYGSARGLSFPSDGTPRQASQAMSAFPAVPGLVSIRRLGAQAHSGLRDALARSVKPPTDAARRQARTVPCRRVRQPRVVRLHPKPRARDRRGGWGVWTSVVAPLFFALVVTLWWICVARVNGQDMRSVSGTSALLYVYSRLPIALGVGTLSLGIRLAVEAGTAPGRGGSRRRLRGGGAVGWRRSGDPQ